jgi:hypothetical protein
MASSILESSSVGCEVRSSTIRYWIAFLAAYLDVYRDADPEGSFDHFEEQRGNNIEFLKNLPPGSGDRKANHAEVGEITLAQMLQEWALHDIAHIRQVAELVRNRSRGNL